MGTPYPQRAPRDPLTAHHLQDLMVDLKECALELLV